MVNIGKKKGKISTLFRLIIFACLLIGVIGLVNAACPPGKLFYKLLPDGVYTDSSDSKKGYGVSDIVVYQRSSGVVAGYIVGKSTALESLPLHPGSCPDCLPFSGDFNGDGVSDIVVYSPSLGIVYGLLSTDFASEGSITFPTCPANDCFPLPGDYDGNDLSDIILYQRSSGYVAGYTLFASGPVWGLLPLHPGSCPDCLPFSGDFDGDGESDIAIYSPSAGIAYGLFSSTGFTTSGSAPFPACSANDCFPLPGDFNGDGVSDVIVYQRSTGYVAGYVLGISTKIDTLQLHPGSCPDCLPFSGDFNGDTISDIVVYSPSLGIVYGRLSPGFTSEGSITFPTCSANDCFPLPGDYDDDCFPPAGYAESNPTPGENPTYSWKYSSWAACDKQCEGTQSREVWCEKNDGTNMGDRSDLCTETKPVTSQSGCGGCNVGQELCSAGVCLPAYWWYRDCDGDSFGDSTFAGDFQISAPIDCGHQYVKDKTDCNDINNKIYPGALEICDGLDNTCDNPAQIDEEGCITNSEWTNSLGNIIYYADKNDTLFMNIRGTNLIGKNISIPNINKKENNVIISLASWLIHFFTGTSNLVTIPASSYSWFAEPGTFSFNTTITKGSDFIHIKDSNDVVVRDTYNNSMPVAIITSPANEINVSAGTNINFNQASYDEDDLLKITWNFGDGTTQTITNYINNSALAGNPNFNTTANVVHNYSSSGRYVVKLIAKEKEEMNRGQADSNEIYVNVFNEGINVFPVISSPENESEEQKRIVFFNASGTFIVNCSTSINGGNDIITNMGITENNKLYCGYIHRSNTEHIPTMGNYEIEMNWIIDGDTSDPVRGDWSSEYYDVVVFRKAFASNGRHNLSLTVTYVSETIQTPKRTSRNFNVETLWSCHQEPGLSYWTNDRYTPVTNCSFKQDELGYACCPPDKKCFEKDGTCRGYASFCFQYPDKSSCELFINYVPEDSISSGLCKITNQTYHIENTNKYCSNMTNCLCKWNTTLSKCVEAVNFTNLCWYVDPNSGEVDDIINEDYGECIWATTEVTDNCNNSLNNMVTKKKATWVSKDNVTPKPAWCKDIEKSYQCVLTEKLPFFDKVGLIIAILLIIAAYLYALKRQKKIVAGLKRKINSKSQKQNRKNQK